MSVFIVAEAGVNHLGARAKMLALCDAAKAAGADAVKFQAYDTWTLAERRGMLESYVGPEGREEMVPKTGDAETFNLLQAAQLTDADLDAIAAHCKSIGLNWFASVFDPSQIERVLSRGAVALKIGHAEADYGALIQAAARHRCDKYISGLPRNGLGWAGEWTFVHGVWEYPAKSPPELDEVGWFDDASLCYMGFSSHYTDCRIPAAAAMRGAEYIEAHLKLSDADPEAAWSLSVEDFGEMVKLIREYEGWL